MPEDDEAEEPITMADIGPLEGDEKKAAIEARLAYLDAEMEKDRARTVAEIDLTTTENVLQEIFEAYDRSFEVNGTVALRATTTRLHAALEVARKYLEVSRD